VFHAFASKAFSPDANGIRAINFARRLAVILVRQPTAARLSKARRGQTCPRFSPRNRPFRLFSPKFIFVLFLFCLTSCSQETRFYRNLGVSWWYEPVGKVFYDNAQKMSEIFDSQLENSTIQIYMDGHAYLCEFKVRPKGKNRVAVFAEFVVPNMIGCTFSDDDKNMFINFQSTRNELKVKEIKKINKNASVWIAASSTAPNRVSKGGFLESDVYDSMVSVAKEQGTKVRFLRPEESSDDSFLSFIFTNEKYDTVIMNIKRVDEY
jgi:hypothetical protein